MQRLAQLKARHGGIQRHALGLWVGRRHAASAGCNGADGGGQLVLDALRRGGHHVAQLDSLRAAQRGIGYDAEVVDVEPVRLIGLGLLTPFYNGNVADKKLLETILTIYMQISSKFLKRTRI